MFGVNGLSLSGYGSTAGVPVNLSGKQLPDSPQLTLRDRRGINDSKIEVDLTTV